MSERVIRQRVVRDEPVDNKVTGDRAVDNRVTAVDEHPQNVADRAIWFVAGVILILLGFRFVLSLLGANTTNGFANFIYTTSHPFVAPFFSLFRYNNINYGASRFEIYTLFAILVYAAVAWLLTRLIDVSRR